MDEWEIIDLIEKSITSNPKKNVILGDDVATLRSEKGLCIINNDMLVAETDSPKQMTMDQTSRKAIAMCISDFAAKGVNPKAILISLGIPKNMEKDQVKKIISGLKDASEEFSVEIIGGDTNECSTLVIDCIITGFSERIITRDGAKKGDIIAVSGKFGYTSAGLKILSEGLERDSEFDKIAISAVLRPTPKLKFGIAMKEAKIPTSSMDSSDWLALTLHEISLKSKVEIRIDKLPEPSGIKKFAEINGDKFEDLILYGGEEYEIVYTIPKNKFKEAQIISKELGAELEQIGTVEKGSPSVKLFDGEKYNPIEKKGWVHLS